MIARRARAVVWGALALPALWLISGYLRDTLSYGETILWSGRASAALLVIAVLVTPLKVMFGRTMIVRALIWHRRALGVASFCYAFLHVAVYAERKASLARMLGEAARLEISSGWVAFAIMLPLALTSNDVSVRRLGRNWKRLHRLVYVATTVLFVHWVLATALLAPAVAAILLVVVFEVWRVAARTP